MWWYLISRSGKWSLKNYSPVSFLCDLCHNIYHEVVFRQDIFSPFYMWNPKVKIWVWARLVKRADLSVSTSQRSGDRLTCFSACVITGSPEGGTHYSISHLKHICACTRLRQMSRLLGRGTNLNIIETVVITLDTPDIPGYIIKIVADMRQAITNHQAD